MKNTIMLIIIDQLRADYVQYMPRCAALLPYHAVCDTNSIPSSTEAMHATISMGVYPKDHGFISKITERGKTGLKELTDRIESGEFSTLAGAATRNGLETYVIGYKPETVQVMGTANECKLRVFADGRKLKIESRDEDLVRELAETYAKYTATSENISTDEQLIRMQLRLSDIWPQGRKLSVLALPHNDILGHKYGPASPEVKTHLQRIDGAIEELIQRMQETTHLLLVGDHGCRRITEHVIEIPSDKLAVAYRKQKDAWVSEEEHRFDEKTIRKIEYDGGMLRLWLEGRSTPLHEDTEFLQRYGTLHNNKKPDRANQNSHHENMGDLTVQANENVIFCRKDWIHDPSVFLRIYQKSNLPEYSIPHGEHGTGHREDRETPALSNFDTKRSRLFTVEIRAILEELMR
jgi:hypothetical protein